MNGLLRFKADHIRHKVRAAAYTIGGQDWPRLFASYDKDRNGNLEYPEFRKMIRTAAKCGPDMIDEDSLKQLFRLIDVDGNSTIDYTEFQQ